jgi:hypothetical protein
VAYFLKARTVETEKQPFPGKGCVTCNNGKLLEAVLSVWSVLRLFNEDQLPLQGSLETAVRRVVVWCEMAASLRGLQSGSRGTSTHADTADFEHLVHAVVNAECVN